MTAKSVVVDAGESHSDDDIELDDNEEAQRYVPQHREYLQPPIPLLQQLAPHLNVEVHRQKENQSPTALLERLQEDAGDLGGEPVVEEHNCQPSTFKLDCIPTHLQNYMQARMMKIRTFLSLSELFCQPRRLNSKASMNMRTTKFRIEMMMKNMMLFYTKGGLES